MSSLNFRSIVPPRECIFVDYITTDSTIIAMTAAATTGLIVASLGHHQDKNSTSRLWPVSGLYWSHTRRHQQRQWRFLPTLSTLLKQSVEGCRSTPSRPPPPGSSVLSRLGLTVATVYWQDDRSADCIQVTAGIQRRSKIIHVAAKYRSLSPLLREKLRYEIFVALRVSCSLATSSGSPYGRDCSYSG